MRITTLIMSEAPSTASATIDSRNEVDSANTTIVSAEGRDRAEHDPPDLAARRPARQHQRGHSAPTPGEARSRPSPQGPAWNTSRANTGSSAYMPPRTTANRSSVIAPEHQRVVPHVAEAREQHATLSGSREAGVRSIADHRSPARRPRRRARSTASRPGPGSPHRAARRAAGPQITASWVADATAAVARASSGSGTTAGSSVWNVVCSKVRAAPMTSTIISSAFAASQPPAVPSASVAPARPATNWHSSARSCAGRSGRRCGRPPARAARPA